MAVDRSGAWRRMVAAVMVVLACTAALAAAEPAKAPPADKTVWMDRVPHIQQKPDFCGEACVAMYAQRLGLPATQDDVFNASQLDPALGRGCYARELDRALTTLGFKTGDVWYRVAAEKRDEVIEQWRDLHGDLTRGVASIICMYASAEPKASEHFRLILGYDAATDEVLFHEPAVAQGAYRRMKLATLLALWPLKYDAERWTVIRFRLEPGDKAAMLKALPPRADAGDPFLPAEDKSRAANFTPADFAQHVMTLRRKIPNDDFTVIVEPPFVVVGDDSPRELRRRCRNTVRWACDKLKAAFFARDPREIFDVWLFKDDDSYTTNCKRIFKTTPTTPYGYFSHKDKSLVMNISTGGGTLVHEIVHAYMAANFPECPTWFNEGLASLYEQCGEEDGEIRGYPNWRLPGLQKGIGDEKLLSFKDLTATTTTQFYEKDKGGNYAQARYLCLYLQEKGLLKRYYRDFHANRREDPTGYKTLVEVLDEKDMKKFQSHWQSWVMKLKR